jgi:hypothetical protein
MSTTTDSKHILVVANETVESPVLRDAIEANVERLDAAEVTIVAPALNSRLRHWLSDDEQARAAAELRLAHCVNGLAAIGIESTGWVGDADPLLAIADALHQAPADLVLVSTHPEGESNWLAHDVVARARERLDVPVVHVVAAERLVLVAA